MAYPGAEGDTEDYSDVNDVKISQLSFTNPATASYVIDRKFSTFHSTGGNIYSVGSGGSLIRFNVESPRDCSTPAVSAFSSTFITTASCKRLLPSTNTST